MSKKIHFDAIGDVHGCADRLKELLKKLGYEKTGHGKKRCWRHPKRKAVFLGDIINRGPQVAESLAIVRAMVDNGAAYAVMGNNEFDALCWCATGSDGRRMETGGEDGFLEMGATHEQIGIESPEWADWIEWIAGLPLWLELKDSEGNPRRFVHACWNPELMDSLLEAKTASGAPVMQGTAGCASLTREGIWEAGNVDSPLRAQMCEIVQGPELECSFPLPPFSGGMKRTSVRLRWYRSAENADLSEMILTRPSRVKKFMAQAPKEGVRISFRGIDVPHLTFIGHYRLDPDEMQPLAEKLICMDYGAVVGGLLAAYRINDGKTKLSVKRIVSIDCSE